jgi:hypothetical protein
LKFVYQTSINTPKQKTQAIVKQACQRAGIEVGLKSVFASVFFSSDVANPDTYSHFYSDIQMYQTIMMQPDPQLRKALVRPEREQLGAFVQIDEAMVGGRSSSFWWPPRPKGAPCVRQKQREAPAGLSR